MHTPPPTINQEGLFRRVWLNIKPASKGFDHSHRLLGASNIEKGAFCRVFSKLSTVDFVSQKYCTGIASENSIIRLPFSTYLTTKGSMSLSIILDFCFTSFHPFFHQILISSLQFLTLSIIMARYQLSV